MKRRGERDPHWYRNTLIGCYLDNGRNTGHPEDYTWGDVALWDWSSEAISFRWTRILLAHFLNSILTMIWAPFLTHVAATVLRPDLINWSSIFDSTSPVCWLYSGSLALSALMGVDFILSDFAKFRKAKAKDRQ